MGSLGRARMAWGSLLLGVSVVALVLVYLGRIGWGAGDLALFLLAATALWGPVAVLVGRWLAHSGCSAQESAALGLATAYAWTAGGYFACASVGLTWLFYVLQAALGVPALVVAWRALRASGGPAPDLGLLLLVTASLLVTTDYKVPFVEGEDGTRIYSVHRDHLFHVGIAAELERGVPPAQSAIRARAKDRAYHVLPHVNTLLLARFSGAESLLEAHLSQHYTAIEILVCLLLFALGCRLTASRAGGYLTAGAMYLLAVPWPPMADEAPTVFAFTLFPHFTTGLEAAAAASPQLYSGLVVLFGCVLASVLVLREAPRQAQIAPTLVLAFLLAAALRFRIHAFLALFPGGVLLLIWAWRRWRGWFAPVALGSLLLVSGLAYLEMLRPSYLPDTAGVGIGYNGLTDSPRAFFNAWPGASWVRAGLERVLEGEGPRRWAWQVLSLSAFALCNVIGFPLALGALAYRRLAPEASLRTYAWLPFSAVIVSVVGGWVLVKGEDSFSIAGQLLFHTRWYLFPLGPAALFSIGMRLQRTGWGARLVPILGGLFLGACLVAQLARSPTPYWETVRSSHRIEITKAEGEALRYLRDQTPKEARVLAARHAAYRTPPARRAAVVSGLAERAAFYEVPAFNVHALAQAVDPEDDREQALQQLWRLGNPGSFCSQLARTGMDYLVEYAARPLQVAGAPCLRAAWSSPGGEITIWEIGDAP